MPISISNQAYVFMCSVVGGMLIAFIYDVFRIKRKAIKTRSIVIHIEDLIYWLMVALVMLGLVYYSNEGEIRGYIFIGSVLGVVLYSVVFSKAVMYISILVLRFLYKVLKIIWIAATYPFRVIIKILSVPARFIFRIASKGLKKAKRVGKSRLSKMAIWRKMLKNIRKKI